MGLKELIFGGGVKVDDTPDAYRGSLQEWLPIKNIIHGMVVTTDHRFIKVMEIIPDATFHLKSPMDQQTSIMYFASYLKVAPDRLQVRVVTQRTDLEEYVRRMKGFLAAETNAACREMIEDNIAEVTRVISTESISHRFFLVMQYEPRMKARGFTIQAIAERLAEEADTARRYLDLCGLEVLIPEYEDNAVLELLYELINKRTARRVKLPPGVFDMMTQVHGIYP